MNTRNKWPAWFPVSCHIYRWTSDALSNKKSEPWSSLSFLIWRLSASMAPVVMLIVSVKIYCRDSHAVSCDGGDESVIDLLPFRFKLFIHTFVPRSPFPTFIPTPLYKRPPLILLIGKKSFKQNVSAAQEKSNLQNQFQKSLACNYAAIQNYLQLLHLCISNYTAQIT